MHFTKGTIKIAKCIVTSIIAFMMVVTLSVKGANTEDYAIKNTDKPVVSAQVPKSLNPDITGIPAKCIIPKDLPYEYESENQESKIEELIEPSEPVIEEPIYIEIPHTDGDVRALECVVEGEAYQSTLEHKQMVACVVVNRLYSDRWSYSSILEVLVDKNQFSAVSNYYNTYYEPDEDTVEAVRSVLAGEVDIEEFSQGAVFFYSPKYSGGYLNSFEKREFLFEIGGNRFFK